MKIFGAFTVIAAAVFLGFTKCRELKTQEKLTFEVISILELLKNEIVTRRTPLKSVFRLIKKNAKLSYITAFADDILSSMDRLGEKSFCDLWHESLSRNFCLLPANIKAALIELGMSLGRYDAEMQEDAIDRCLSIVSKEHEELKEKLKTNEKMYMGLYSGVGAIIAIVFI